MASSIREKKFAATKLAILQALIRRIETEPLDDISVKDICHDSNIAVATFFLYYPHKTSILDYFIQLWRVEISWRVERNTSVLSPLAVLEDIFEYTGMRMEQRPELMAEVISYMARKRDAELHHPLSAIELAYAFPDSPGIESAGPKSLGEIFTTLIESATAKGELPKEMDLEATVFACISILLATPVLTKAFGGGSVRQEYRRQLGLLWAGVRRLNRKQSG